MALTTGQKLTLFLLVSSRSEFRLALEGRSKTHVPPNPSPTLTDFQNRLNGVAPSIGIDPGDLLGTNVGFLWVGPRQSGGIPDKQVANITTDHYEIVQRVGLQGLYTPDDPCPGGGQQTSVWTALKPIP